MRTRRASWASTRPSCWACDRKEEHRKAGGCPGLPSIQAQDDKHGKAVVQGMMRGLLEQGIMPYSASLGYICYSHTPGDMEQALKAIDNTLAHLRTMPQA